MAFPQDVEKKLTGDFGIRINEWPIFILGVALLAVAFLFMPRGVSLAISMALFLSPLWLPLLLISGAWALWVILKRSEFIAAQDTILLEIKPPRSLVKTPLAMEAFLSGIHHGPGEGTWYAKYIQGKVRPWWSLEIVSLEGTVHFFIWTRAGFRRIIEAQMYAQYPGVQIAEVPDYSRQITAKPEDYVIWGCDFAHTEDDPLPIKTYVEYGLGQVQKEEEQIDPLANLVETLGSLGKGEYLWIQLIIRTHKGEKYAKKNAKGKAYTWKDKAKDMIDKMREDFVKEAQKAAKVPPGGSAFPAPTKGQQDLIAAIERNISKQAFDVGIRGLYLARPENFQGLTIAALTGIFRHFTSEGWNGFRPARGMIQFDDYPWEIGTNKLKNAVRNDLVQAYRRRQFFHEPFDLHRSAMVMSTEELATIYHIPSRAITAPSLGRITSATGEAPSNLPT